MATPNPILESLKGATLALGNKDVVGQRAGITPLKNVGKYDRGLTTASYESNVGLNAQQAQEYYRGATQSAPNKLWKGFVKATGSVATKTGQGAGHVLGFLGDVWDGELSELTYDNAIVKAFAEAEQWIKESLPVYAQQQYAEGNFLQKMGTADFWANDFFDGLAFMTSAYVPAGILGKVGSSAKALSGSSKKMGQIMGKALSKTTEATGVNTSLALTTFYNTVSEAGFEAHEANKNLREEYAKAQGYESYQELPKHVKNLVDQKAGEAAARTFAWNAAALVGPNFLQSKWFLGSPASNAEVLRNAVRSGQMKAGQALGETKSYLKKFGQGFLSEGLWEENMQTAIQAYETRLAQGLEKEDHTGGPINHLLNNAWAFTKATFTLGKHAPYAGSHEDEAAMAIMLGGMIGGGMSTVSNYWESQRKREGVKADQTLWDKLKKINGASTNLLVDDYSTPFKQFDEGTINPETGKAEIDPQKQFNLLANSTINKNQIMEELSATALGDSNWSEFNKAMAAAAHVWRLGSTGMSKQDMKDLLQYDTQESEEVGAINDLMSTMVDQYHATKSNAMSKEALSESATDRKYAAFKFRNQFYLTNKLNYLQSVASKEAFQTEEGQTMMEALIQETENDLQYIQSNQMKKDFDQEINYPSRLASEIDELVRQIADPETTTDKALLQEQLDEKLILMNHAQNIYGLEQISYGQDLENQGLTPLLKQSSSAFPSFEPRLMSEAPRNIKDNIFYHEGRNLISDQRMDQMEDDAQLTEFLLNNYEYPSNKAVSTASRLREVYQNKADEASGLIDELRTVGAEISGAVEDAREFGLDPMQLVESESAKSLIATGQAGLNKSSQENQAAADALIPALEQQRIDSTSKAQRLNDFLSKMEERGLDMVGYYDTAKEDLPALFMRLATRSDIIEPTRSFINDFERSPDTFFKDREAATLKRRLQIYTRLDIPGYENTFAELLERLDEILQKIQENKNDRIEVQQFIDYTRTEILKGMTDFISAYLPAAIPMLDKLEDEGTNSTASFVLLKGIYDNESLANQTHLLEALKRERDGITNRLNSMKPGGLTLAEDLQGIFQNPKKYAAYLLRVLADRGAEFDNPRSIYYAFSKDKDLYRFAYNYSKKLTEEQKDPRVEQIAQLLLQADVMATLITTLEARIKAVDVAKAQTDILQQFLGEQAEIAPSAQQLMALNDLIYSTWNGKKNWENVMVLKGVLGSGKSLVGAKLFFEIWKKLSGWADENVVAFGHSKHASENIAKSLFGDASKASSIEGFQNMQLDDISLVVVDEAMAMANDVWTNPQGTGIYDRINEWNTNHPSGRLIKILALGDASQITVESPDLTTIGSITHPRTKDTTPLSVIYRTSVPAISDAALTFKDYPEGIDQISSTSNTSFEEALVADNADNFYGVTGGMNGRGVANIKSFIEKPTAKSRVVIVNNQQAKADMITQIGTPQGVEVLTYYEAQSRQWDQVYIAMDPTQPTFQGERFSDLTFNNAMYTMIGRAKEFVHLEVPGLRVDTIINPTLDQAAEDTSKDLTANQAYLSDYLNSLSTLTGQTPVIDNTQDEVVDDEVEQDVQETPDVVDEIVDEVEEQVRQEIPEEQPLPIPPEQETAQDVQQGKPIIHNTAHPSSSVDLARVRAGEQGYIMAVQSKKGGVEYHVVAYDQDTGNYISVAVLGAKDLMDTDYSPRGADLLAELTVKQVPTTPRGIGGVNTLQSGFQMTDDMRQSIVMSINFTSANNLKYNYSKNENGTYNFKNKPIIRNLFKFYEDFFNRRGSDGEIVDDMARMPEIPFMGDNGLPNQTLLKKQVKVAIFSNSGRSDDPYTLDKPMWQNSKFQPKVGVPYLVIYKANEQGQKADTEPQLIRLEPRKINTNDSYYRILADTETGFTQLERALSNAGINLKLGQAPFNHLIKDVSKIYSATQSSIVLPQGTSVVEFLKNYGTIDFTGLSNEQLQEVATSLDYLVTNITHAPSFEVIKMTKGEAQARVKEDPSLAIEQVVNVSDEVMTKDPKVFALVMNKEELMEDSSAKSEYLKDYVVASKNSPAQRALNAIAKANASVNDINIRVTKRTGSGDITLAKSLLADETTYGDFWTKYRAILLDYLNQAVEAAVNAGMDRTEAQEIFTPRSINNPEKYASTSRLEKILFNAIKINQPDSYQQAIESFEASIKEMKDKLSVNTINVGTLTKMLQLDQDGNTSMRLPLLRKSPSSSTTKVGVNDLGSNVSDNLEQLQGMLSSAFTGVTPNNVQFQWTPTGLAQAPTEQQLPEPEPTRAADAYAPTSMDDNNITYKALERLYDIQANSSKMSRLAAILEKGINTTEGNIKVFSMNNPQPGVLGVTYTKDKLSNPEPWMPRTLVNIADINSVSDSVLMHELLHGLTIDAIDRVLRTDNFTEAEKDMVTNLSILEMEFKEAVKKEGLNPDDFYQPTKSRKDLKEFVASLSYPPMYEKLSEIMIDNRSLVARVLDVILKALGVKQASIFQAAEQVLSQYVSTITSEQTIDDVDITDLFDDEMSFATEQDNSSTEDMVASNGAELNDDQIRSAVSKLVKFNLSTNTAKFVLSLLNTHYLNPNLPLAKQVFKLARVITKIDENAGNLIFRTKAIQSLIKHFWNKAISFDDKRRIRAILATAKNDRKVLDLPIDKIRDMFAESYSDYNTYNSSLFNEMFRSIDEFIQVLNEDAPSKNISNVLSNLQSSDKRVNMDHGDVKNLRFILANFASTQTYTTARLMMMDFLKSAIDQNESATNGQVVRSREEIIQKVYNDLLKRYNVTAKKHRKQNTPASGTELSALNSLLASDINGVPVYFKMINLIYPKWNLTSTDQVDLFVNVEEDRKIIDEHTEGLRKETEEGAYVDAESRLTDSVKEFFSLVENKDAKRISRTHPNRFYSARYTFLATTQMLIKYLDLNNLEMAEEQLAELERSADVGVYEKDVLQHLISLIQKAYRTTPKNKKIFIMEDSFGATRVAFMKSDQDISKDGLVVARQKSSFAVVREGSLEKLYRDLKTKGHVDSIQEFNSLYIAAKAQNTLRELQNSLASLAEKDYRIGLFENKGQNSFEVRYINATGFGLEKSVGSTIREFIKSNYEANGDIKVIFGSLSNLIPELKKRNKEALGSFLAYFDLDTLVDNINVSTSNQAVFDDVAGFIERLNTFNPQNDNIDEFLADQSGFVASLSKVLKANDKLLKASSILDSLGNRIYRYTVKSWFYNMAELFTQTRAGNWFKGATGYLKYARNTAPAYLTTRFYKSNIFSQGLNKIYRVFEHDSSKNENSDYSTTFLRESPSDWLFRNFTLGFLSEVDRAPKRLNYTQFLYQVADKPRMPGSEISILDEAKLKEAIGMAVDQLSNKNTRFDKKVSINFTTYDDVVKRLGPEGTKEQIVDEIFKDLIKQADAFSQTIVDKETRIPRNIQKINNALKNLDPNNTFGIQDVNIPANLTIRDKTIYENTKVLNAIQPAFRLYYLNQYVNGYFLNQLYTGPFNAFKHGEDIVKRMAGVMAPGIRPLVNSLFGTPKFSRYLVIEDNNKEKVDITNFIKEMIPDITDQRMAEMTQFFESFASTDAQGFMLPSRWDELTRGFGASYSLGRVLKPVYYSVGVKEVVDATYATEEEANAAAFEGQQVKQVQVGDDIKYAVVEQIPIASYLKYSSIVLTNDLVNRFPELKKIAQFMRTNNAGEVVFKSAVKVGGPDSRVSFDHINSNATLDDSYFGEIDNNYYKLQLNPKAKVDSKVSIFTQLMYFLNILNTNVDEANQAYAAVSYLNSLNLNEFVKRLVTEKSTAGFIKSKLNDPSSERYAEILGAGISINNPTLVSKALNAIMAGIESQVLKIKFPGSKLVLQSEQYITKKDGTRLKFVNKPDRYYAEVVLPKSMMTPQMQEMLDKGEDLYLTADYFGYRIPSTELHSAVPLKVVATYDAVDTNVIIAPFELVYLHGSDFDVDSLFVPTREKLTAPAAKYLGMDKDIPLGYIVNDKGQHIWDGFAEQERILSKIETDKATAQKFYNRYKDVNAEQAAIYSKETNYLDKLAAQVSEKIAKNLIVETMLSTITKPSNRERMLAPIVMANYNAVEMQGSVANYLNSLGLWPKTRLNDLSRMDQAMAAFSSLQDGVRLTGIFANNIKVLAYLARSGAAKNSPAKVREDLEIKFDGKVFNQISDKDAETGELTWMYQDGAVNLAIDNLKEQTLSKLGINPITGNAFSALIGLGFPIKDAVLMMRNKTIKFLIDQSLIKGGDQRFEKELSILINGLNTAQDMPLLEIINLNQHKLTRQDLENLAQGNEVSDDIVLAAAGIFYKAYTIGNSVRQLSSALNVIRTVPTNFEDILKYNQNLNELFDAQTLMNMEAEPVDGYTKLSEYSQKINNQIVSVDFRDSFAFDAPNFLSENPHIAASFRTYFRGLQAVQDNLLIFSNDVQRFVKSLDIPLNRFGKRDVNQNVLTNELSKFMISSTVFSRLIAISPLVNKRRKIYKTNIASFNAKFSELISNLKKNDLIRAKELGASPNRFIQSLVSDNTLGYPRVRMSGGTNLENVDIIELKADFIELGKYTMNELGNVTYNEDVIPNTQVPNQIQQMFIDYIILSTGFKLSSTSYSSVIPESMYKAIDKEYSEKLRMLKNSEIFRQKVKPILEINLAIRYASELQKPDTAPVKNTDGTYAGRDGNIYYDRKYKTDENATAPQKEKSFPKYISTYFRDEQTNQAKYTVYVRISGTDQPFVYYRQVGRKRNDSYLVNLDGYMNPQRMEGWSLETKFNPNVRDVAVFNVGTNTMRTNKSIAEGEVVQIHAYDDLTRMNAKTVTVGKLVSEDNSGFKIYNITEVPQQQDELSFAITDPVNEFLAQVTNTTNNQNCK